MEKHKRFTESCLLMPGSQERLRFQQKGYGLMVNAQKIGWILRKGNKVKQDKIIMGFVRYTYD